MPVTETKAPEDFRVCNCADCGRELLARAQRGALALLSKDERATLPKLELAGRFGGRPYCRNCLNAKNGGGSQRWDAEDRTPRQRGPRSDDNPGLDNATRAREGD